MQEFCKRVNYLQSCQEEGAVVVAAITRITTDLEKEEVVGAAVVVREAEEEDTGMAFSSVSIESTLKVLLKAALN